MEIRTDFLFSTPNFLEGAGNVINLAGNYHEYAVSETGDGADKKAIRNDFFVIGKDLFNAMMIFKNQHIEK